MITAETPATPATAAAPPTPARAALAGAIDAQARRMDQLSAAIVHATAQVTWSGHAAERFRVRAAERSRECLQLAVALRASAERVHAAATAPPRAAVHAGRAAGGGSFGGAAVDEPFGAGFGTGVGAPVGAAGGTAAEFVR
ncbi:MAG: hypothetical protein ACJ786_12325 [Catenulispora sp.]